MGYVTSPWWSPELGTNIALAWVPWTSSEVGTKLLVRLPDEFSESPGVPVARRNRRCSISESLSTLTNGKFN